MTAGFALVAFPVDYESSGIMTFIVNQQGNVYQKDLGPDTTRDCAADDASTTPTQAGRLAKD